MSPDSKTGFRFSQSQMVYLIKEVFCVIIELELVKYEALKL